MIDLKTLQREEVSVPNEVTQIGGWSPDGRYLAFVQTPPVRAGFKPGDLKDSWLTIYDSETKSVQRLTEATNVAETYFFWVPVGTHSTASLIYENDGTKNGTQWNASLPFIFVTKPVTNPLAAAEIHLGNLRSSRGDEAQTEVRNANSTGRVGQSLLTSAATISGKISNYMPELLTISSNTAAYAYKGNLYELELKVLPRSEKWGWDDNAKVVRQLTAMGRE